MLLEHADTMSCIGKLPHSIPIVCYKKQHIHFALVPVTFVGYFAAIWHGGMS